MYGAYIFNDFYYKHKYFIFGITYKNFMKTFLALLLKSTESALIMSATDALVPDISYPLRRMLEILFYRNFWMYKNI